MCVCVCVCITIFMIMILNKTDVFLNNTQAKNQEIELIFHVLF